MSEHPHQPSSGSDRPSTEPRLAPRPLARPPVDPASEAVFGRPDGVGGAFSPPSGQQAFASGNGAAVAAPPPSLAQAFGRSPEEQDVILQRPPGERSANGSSEGALWSKPSDPWRDPGAGAMLGGPALTVESEDEDERDRPKGVMLTLSEVLFGHRVRPTALAALGAIVLVIATVGGLVGFLIAQQGNELTGEVTLAEAQAAKERPPGSVADIAQRVSPAVVSIEVITGDAGSGGSGVIIDGKGYIVTNHHVVSSAVKDKKAKMSVVFADGSRSDAKLVGTDPGTDIAVLKVNVKNPTVIAIGKSADLAPGDTVLAIGSPLGLENTITQGIVSAVNRPVIFPGEDEKTQVAFGGIQTDAAINHGNSGGALVDATGALVGINQSIKAFGNAQGQAGSIGLGFAIPVEDVVKISEVLIEGGKVEHASLGAKVASVTGNTSEGAQVQDVTGGGPAERAGIKEGDILIRLGSRQVRNSAELVVAVRQHEVGETVPIKLVRQGRALVVDVKLGSD